MRISKKFFQIIKIKKPIHNVNKALYLNNIANTEKLASAKPDKLTRIVTAYEEHCNYHCDFCYAGNAKKNNNKPKKNEVYINKKTNKQIEKLANALKKATNCNRFMLTGGEPLLCKPKDLLDLVKRISKITKPNDFWICTNGSLLDNNLSKKLYKSGLRKIVVSLSAETQKKYASYTGQVNHELNKILKNIKDSIKNGLNTKVDVPIFKTGIKNPTEFFNLMKLLNKKGVKEVAYFDLYTTENNKDIIKNLYTSSDIITTALKKDKNTQIFQTETGQKRFKYKPEENSASIDIIIPASTKNNANDLNNCKIENKCTDDFCQGTYSAYLEPKKGNFNIKCCNTTFPDERNIIKFGDITNKRANNPELIDKVKKVWKWSYEK